MNDPFVSDPTLLKCWHPRDCLRRDAEKDDDAYCGWCRHIGLLDDQIEMLRRVIHDQAIIVRKGCKLIVASPVGMLEVYGGEVTLTDKVSVEELTLFQGTVRGPGNGGRAKVTEGMPDA